MKEKLRTLHKLGRTISATFNEEELFTLITESLIFKLGFAKCLIFLIDEKSKQMICKTEIGCKSEEIKNIKSKIISGKEEKELMVVPIVVKEIVNGFIVAGNNPPSRRVTEQDLEVVSILANQVGAAVENTRLYQGLWSSQQELEMRIKKRTTELAEVNKELKRLDKMKSDFVSLVSHELRTPLTAIKGYASILMDEKLGEVNPGQKERLAKINKHSASLINLVNNLLDISRIESGRIEMRIERISLREMVDGVIDILNPQLVEKKLVLKVEVPPELICVWADKDQLERVFINLLGNAVKFSPDNGKIIISALDKKDSIQIDISDTGIGIATDNLLKIFDEFYRVDNPINTEKKGAGLGLSLVKRIISAHKGEIWVRSKLMEGTTFSFTLPKQRRYDG